MATDNDNTILIKAKLDDQKLGTEVVESIIALFHRDHKLLRIKILDDRAHETVYVPRDEEGVAQQWPSFESAILDIGSRTAIEDVEPLE